MLTRGSSVAGFVVLEELGAGGMGVVYAAYDPKLDRRVALKVVKAESEQQDRRLLREAQALARLNHPNVVGVHDAGSRDGRVWLAMEYVAGQTLTQWRKAPRRWSEVVAVFRDAGAGLEAAHEAGLLHRDFKPDNVMIDGEGRVRVMDFGLARVSEHEEFVTETDETDATERLTQVGRVVGTPAFMSLEQISGGEVGPSSDQFSFFVSLWETLYGERPYRANSVVRLESVLRAAKPSKPEGGTRVPAWLHAACLKGLAADPNARFPSMGAALDVLARGEGRRRRRELTLAATAVLAVGGAALGVHQWGRANDREACEEAGSAVTQLWNATERQAVRDAMLSTGVSYAASTADRVDGLLEGYAQAWKAAQTSACLLTRVEGQWAEDTYERAQWCLEDRRLGLQSRVALLRDIDKQSASRAINAVAGLRSPAPCVDASALQQREPPPAIPDRPAVLDVREQLARAAAASGAGRYAQGLELARAARQQASALGWAPLEASAALTEGKLLTMSGDLQAGAATTRAAYDAALRARAWRTAAVAANELVRDHGAKLSNREVGEAWAEHAEVAIGLAGDPLGELGASRVNNLASTYSKAGKHREALAAFQDALATKREQLGNDHPDVPRFLNNIGQEHTTLGDFEAAQRTLEQSYELKAKLLGDDHPSTVQTLSSIAELLVFRGDYEAAERTAEEVRTRLTQIYGADDYRVGVALRTLAVVSVRTGQFEDAQRRFSDVLRIFRDEFGPDDPRIAMISQDLATARAAGGDLEGAEEMFREALRAVEASLGPEAPLAAAVLHNLALLMSKREKFKEAVEFGQRALPIYETKLGREHPDVARCLRTLAAARLALDAKADVRADLDRALAIWDASGKTDGPEAKQVRALLEEAKSP